MEMRHGEFRAIGASKCFFGEEGGRQNAVPGGGKGNWGGLWSVAVSRGPCRVHGLG
jgi:hypothetical protein